MLSPLICLCCELAMLLSHWFPRLRSVNRSTIGRDVALDRLTATLWGALLDCGLIARSKNAPQRVAVKRSSRIVEQLEVRSLLTPAAVFVNSAWAAVTIGTDPDGPGPATDFGVDAFASIQPGIDAVQANGTVSVSPGSYVETLSIGKSLTLQGTSGRAPDAVVSPLLASDNVITISAGATNVTLQHLTATGGAIGIVSLAAGSVAAINVSASANSGNGLDVANASDVTIEGGTWSGLKSRSVGNVTLQLYISRRDCLCCLGRAGITGCAFGCRAERRLCTYHPNPQPGQCAYGTQRWSTRICPSSSTQPVLASPATP